MKPVSYQINRRGEIKSLPLVTHKDGTLWSTTDAPLLNSEAPGFIRLGKEKIVALAKAKKWNEIPHDCYCKVGINTGDLTIKSYGEIRKEEEGAMTPAQKERIRISHLFAKAHKRENNTDDCNVMDSMSIRAEASSALKKWRENYPAEALEEDAKNLEAKANHEEDLAAGALVYDADGWLSSSDQQKSHDDHMTKAKALLDQAKALRDTIYPSHLSP
jgi:hypothetical protein